MMATIVPTILATLLTPASALSSPSTTRTLSAAAGAEQPALVLAVAQPTAATHVRNRVGELKPRHAAPRTMVSADPASITRDASIRPVPRQVQELPRITVYFQDAPISDVLATFAEYSGRSIVAGAGIEGTVTADIRDQPWDVALDAILQAQGLAARELESGIIRVDNVGDLREREAQQPLVTRQFRIDYISADSVRSAIEGLLSERGRVTVNSGTNSLVVTDGRPVFDRIAPMVEQLDVRTPQVTIAAKIIFVDRSALEELGIVYDLKDSRGNQINRVVPGAIDQNGDGVVNRLQEGTTENVVLLGGTSVAALANANYRPSLPALQVISSLMLGRHTLITFLEALQSLNLTDIQAAPVITTLDHREAYVQVGEETPIRVVDVGAAGAAGTPPRANVQMKETGVILRVTPHVTGDQVLLELHAERSNVAAAASDIGFTFQTQESETQILLDDGETGVISGLTIIQKDRVRAGIPFLMDLPLLGRLFRFTHEQESKQDLLITVTPHIVRPNDP